MGNKTQHNRGDNKISYKNTKGGYVIGVDNKNNIYTIADIVGHIVSVGNKVVSNGNIFAPKMMKGTVIAIMEPYKNGRTSDIILVLFPNIGECFMKLKDLIV